MKVTDQVNTPPPPNSITFGQPSTLTPLDQKLSDEDTPSLSRCEDHTSKMYMYLMDMHVPGGHACTWWTRMYLVDTHVSGGHACTWWTRMYLVDMHVPGGPGAHLEPLKHYTVHKVWGRGCPWSVRPCPWEEQDLHTLNRAWCDVGSDSHEVQRLQNWWHVCWKRCVVHVNHSTHHD